jgi:hypothetical protein
MQRRTLQAFGPLLWRHSESRTLPSCDLCGSRITSVLSGVSITRKRHESAMNRVIGRGVSNGSLCLLHT